LARGSVARGWRCTPKMFIPALASARAVAAPNPLDAPNMSAHRSCNEFSLMVSPFLPSNVRFR
jgi:hypothetical protein